MEQFWIWDRVPDPTVFSIGAPRALAPTAIKTALAEWIHASGVPVDQFIFHGSVPQRRFHLQVRGGAAAPARALALSLEHPRHQLAPAHSAALTQVVPTLLYTPVPTRTLSISGWSFKQNASSASCRTPSQMTASEHSGPRASSLLM
eukprot:2260434-Pyramimonas_sp.AAC.1